MAQSYTTDAGTLIIPGAYSSYKVQNGAGGLAVSGVIFLVGEADSGPDYSLESDLSLNLFGPSSAADVVAKYKSGPLVDAYKAACTPADDPDILGSPAAFVLVKTNPSTKASSALGKIGGGTYATLYDKAYGALGNLIYYTVTSKVAEVKPTTGTFTYIPAVGTVNANLRINGGADLSLALIANTTPTAFVTAVGGLTGISASGGAARTTAQSAVGTLAVAVVAGNQITITYSGTFTTTPSVGDTVVIPSGSVIVGASQANAGAYVVTAATSSVISCTKLSDAGKTAPVPSPGTISPPAAVGAATVSATVANDLVVYAPVTITTSSSTVIDGVGKTLELNELGTGTDLLSRTAYQLGTTTAVTWVSKTGAATVLTSAAEYAVSLNTNRQLDAVTETLSAGGKIALQLGYTGTSCGVVVSPTGITLTPVGGASGGQTISLLFSAYPTIADLAAYIAAQPGFVAKAGTATMGQLAPTALDEGSFTCGSDFGAYTLRLKTDAVAFYQAVSQSALVQLGNPVAPAAAGLPNVTSATAYLAGGARGATTDAIFNAAIDALESVRGNFLVPLFSADATTEKAYSVNPTDASSTYTIANIHAYAKTHCLKMSQLKRRKNRQALLAQRDTFANVQTEAANLASARVALAFQDVKLTSTNGIQQFQPHMLAALAAGMQSAGFYRALVHKGINCSGVVQAAADFKDASDDNVETALEGGLLIAKKDVDGGFIWVSDQTTYSKDSNFVYNSIQAVYVADIMALTLAQRMEKAFVGQSLADVTPAVAYAALEAIMADFMRLKLIAPSDDAPKGFKNASIKISGPTMQVTLEVKLAGALYFINIPFLVSQVTSSVSA